MSGSQIAPAEQADHDAADRLVAMLQRCAPGHDVLTILGEDAVIVVARGKAAKDLMAFNRSHGFKVPGEAN